MTKISAALKSHPLFAVEDLEYLQGKGYSEAEILALWDRDVALGKEPMRFNKNSPEWQAHLAGVARAMGLTR